MPTHPAVERAAMKALDLLPKNLVSRAFGVVSELRLHPNMRGFVNTSFARLVGVNLDESERTPDTYRSLNDFFTRRLKPGSRPIEADRADALVSPVDGRLTQFGPIVADTLIQAKGKEFNLIELLDSAREAARFRGGSYATIYLSPRDYHRIHSPTQGAVERVSYIPGHLWPVNALSVKHVERLFAVNERLITFLSDSPLRRVAVIKVGATCVGRIGLAFDELQSNQGGDRRRDIELADPPPIQHGEELAVFNLGSTVILLIAHPGFAFRADLAQGQVVRLGELLGHVEPPEGEVDPLHDEEA